MTTLYLVRHGQTDWNDQHRWQGRRDVPMNDAGRTQAAALARAFTAIAVERVFSSDLSRARDTAAVIAEAVNVPHVILPSLRERSFGRWEGRTNEEILAAFPEEMAEYQKNRDGFAPPDGQSWNDFAPRAVAAIDAIAGDYLDRQFAVVAHGGPLKAFLNHVLGIERGPLNEFVLNNASISVVRRRHEITGRVWWQIAALNITCHLHDSGFWLRDSAP